MAQVRSSLLSPTLRSPVYCPHVSLRVRSRGRSRAQQSWSQLSVRERLRPVRRLRAFWSSAPMTSSRRSPPTSAGRRRGALVRNWRPPRTQVPRTEGERTPRAAKVVAVRPIWLMGSRDVVHRRPWGVVGIIGTWNYPVFLNAVQVAQALVAGNAVVWKPSENVPRTRT